MRTVPSTHRFLFISKPGPRGNRASRSAPPEAPLALGQPLMAPGQAQPAVGHSQLAPGQARLALGSSQLAPGHAPLALRHATRAPSLVAPPAKTPSQAPGQATPAPTQAVLSLGAATRAPQAKTRAPGRRTWRTARASPMCGIGHALVYRPSRAPREAAPAAGRPIDRRVQLSESAPDADRTRATVDSSTTAAARAVRAAVPLATRR